MLCIEKNQLFWLTECLLDASLRRPFALKGSDLPSAVSVLTEWILREELQRVPEGTSGILPSYQPCICRDPSLFQRESNGCVTFKLLEDEELLLYLPASLVVVQVHERAAGRLAFTPLPHVHEGLREGHSVGDVVAAARPLEP